MNDNYSIRIHTQLCTAQEHMDVQNKEWQTPLLKENTICTNLAPWDCDRLQKGLNTWGVKWGKEKETEFLISYKELKPKVEAEKQYCCSTGCLAPHNSSQVQRMSQLDINYKVTEHSLWVILMYFYKKKNIKCTINVFQNEHCPKWWIVVWNARR